MVGVGGQSEGLDPPPSSPQPLEASSLGLPKSARSCLCKRLNTICCLQTQLMHHFGSAVTGEYLISKPFTDFCACVQYNDASSIFFL